MVTQEEWEKGTTRNVAPALLELQKRLRVIFGTQMSKTLVEGWDWQVESEQMFMHEMARRHLLESLDKANAKANRRWSEEEDDTLHQLQKELGSDWKQIATRISGRSEEAVKGRWTTKVKWRKRQFAEVGDALLPLQQNPKPRKLAKPATSYARFLGERTAGSHGKVDYKAIGEAWASLTAEEKRPYELAYEMEVAGREREAEIALAREKSEAEAREREEKSEAERRKQEARRVVEAESLSQSQGRSGGKKKQKNRCGLCPGCTRSNCNDCKYCLDKKVNGGTGKMKHACVLRTCTGKYTELMAAGRPRNSKLCPGCMEYVQAGSRFCKLCGHDFKLIRHNGR
jgi:hypothetical protein